MTSETPDNMSQQASVPGVTSLIETAKQGVAHLTHISGLLAEHRGTTEAAVNEIFAVVGRVEALLEQVAQAPEMSEESRTTLGEAQEVFSLIYSALQFQDIASQQGEAINALMAGLGKVLVSLAGNASEVGLPQIEVREGTFDGQATFDRAKSRQSQQEVDELFEELTDEPGQEKRSL